MAAPPTAPLSTLASIFLDAALLMANPNSCSRLALASLASMAKLPGGTAAIARHHPDVLRICMAYFTCPVDSDPEGMVALTGVSWFKCPCDRRIGGLPRALHAWAAAERLVDPRQTVMAVQKHFLAVLNAALKDVKPEKTIRSLWRKERKGWPQTPNDLAPYGMQQSIDALLEWASNQCPLPDVLELLGHIVEMSPDAGAASLLIRHPLLPKSLASVLAMINVSVAEHCDSESAETQLGHLDAVAHLLVLFNSASVDDVGRFVLNGGPDIAHFLAQSTAFMRQATVLASRTGYTGPADGPESPSASVLHVYGMVCAAILRATGGPVDAGRYHPITVAVYRSTTGTARQSPFMAIQAPLRELSHGGACARAECEARSVNSGRQFSVCDRCKMVAYCSRECQKRAWLDKASAHKGVCQGMKNVRTVALPSGTYKLEDPDVFCQKCVSAGLDEEMTWKIVAHLRYVLDME